MKGGCGQWVWLTGVITLIKLIHDFILLNVNLLHTSYTMINASALLKYTAVVE